MEASFVGKTECNGVIERFIRVINAFAYFSAVRIVSNTLLGFLV